MNNQLKLTIEGFSNLEEHGTKEDGTPDVRVSKGFTIRIVENNARILFEETLPRDKMPIDPTSYLTERIAKILAAYLPQIDPEWRS